MYVMGLCYLFVWREMALTQVGLPELGHEIHHPGHGSRKPVSLRPVQVMDYQWPQSPMEQEVSTRQISYTQFCLRFIGAYWWSVTVSDSWVSVVGDIP